MDDDPTWFNLVLWLQSKGMDEELLVRSKRVPGAGRGLFTIKDVPPNTPLFTVPKSAHMNFRTLRPFYKSTRSVQTLSATQLISMHIFLHRPCIEEGQNISRDPTFGPYIDILPPDFDGHPLSWKIATSQENSKERYLLLSFLPPGVNSALKAMEDRFLEDWKTVCGILMEHPHIAKSTRRLDICLSPFLPELHTPEYLWAWLNVNTRCVYHRISASPSDPDNITLCPLLDLANHTSASTYAPPALPIPTFFSPSSRSLEAEQEVYLRYGSHSNSTLFTEYGFIEAHPESGGQADVQEIMEKLFQEKGPSGEWMKATLIEANYWGDWKLYESPSPAHPSYRLLPALRLLHLSLPLSSDGDAGFDHAPELATWRETILGDVDIVSPENEDLVWKTLDDICRGGSQHAEEQYHKLEKEIQAKEYTGWVKYAAHAILSLWLEEKRVCQAVSQSIVEGHEMD